MRFLGPSKQEAKEVIATKAATTAKGQEENQLPVDGVLSQVFGLGFAFISLFFGGPLLKASPRLIPVSSTGLLQLSEEGGPRCGEAVSSPDQIQRPMDLFELTRELLKAVDAPLERVISGLAAFSAFSPEQRREIAAVEDLVGQMIHSIRRLYKEGVGDLIRGVEIKAKDSAMVGLSKREILNLLAGHQWQEVLDSMTRPEWGPEIVTEFALLLWKLSPKVPSVRQKFLDVLLSKETHPLVLLEFLVENPEAFTPGRPQFIHTLFAKRWEEAMRGEESDRGDSLEPSLAISLEVQPSMRGSGGGLSKIFYQLNESRGSRGSRGLPSFKNQVGGGSSGDGLQHVVVVEGSPSFLVPFLYGV